MKHEDRIPTQQEHACIESNHVEVGRMRFLVEPGGLRASVCVGQSYSTYTSVLVRPPSAASAGRLSWTTWGLGGCCSG